MSIKKQDLFTTTKFNTKSSADEKHICVREHDQKTIFRDILPLRKEICKAIHGLLRTQYVDSKIL